MLLSRKLCTFLLRYLKTHHNELYFHHHHHLWSLLATWKYTKAHKGLYIFNKPDVIIMFILKSFLKCLLWFFIYNYKFSSPSIFNLWSLTAFHWSGSSTTLSGNITLSCGPDQIYKEINLKMEFVKVRITLWARNFYPFLPAKQQLLNWRPCRCTWRCGPGLWSGLQRNNLKKEFIVASLTLWLRYFFILTCQQLSCWRHSRCRWSWGAGHTSGLSKFILFWKPFCCWTCSCLYLETRQTNASDDIKYLYLSVASRVNPQNEFENRQKYR